MIGLTAIPGRYALTGGAIKSSEVLFDLAKIGEQTACGRHHLQEAILHAGGIHNAMLKPTGFPLDRFSGLLQLLGTCILTPWNCNMLL